MPKKKFDVEIPLLNTSIGVLGPGKTIKLDLTRMTKGKNMEAVFSVSGGIAKEKKLFLLSSYIARIMRTGVSYVEDSFSCKAKNALLRVKPFLLTRKKVSRAIRKALRDKCRKLIEKYCAEKNTREIFSAIISSNLQRELAGKLKKIYPLAVCEIRVIEIEKEEELEGEKKK